MTIEVAISPLPAALLNPAAFPHRPERVELRETHISWVFLAGEKAYKVKKPVRFPFLDYGTLQRRRALCHAEVDLNARFAPALYHGVVRLIPHGLGALEVAPEHDPRAVEYAVVDDPLRRVRDARRRPRSRPDGGGGHQRRRRGARSTCTSARPCAMTEASGGSPRVIDETLATLAEAGAPARRVEELGRFCRAALAAFGPELEERARLGRVRDGHGDLRAEHVLIGEAIQLVDAIEFDPELRLADVGYDLAFLVMDVTRTDDDLARALVRGYRAAGGDPGSERLLAFFCAVRALVRAKVDLLRAAQLTGAAEQARTARGLALLELAERFAWRARLPRLVCVAGFAASGKSTVAEALATAAGRPVISSDRIRKLRAGIDPYERAAPSAYGDIESRAVYAELAQRARIAIRESGGAIVDATFRRKADADAFAAVSPLAASAAWIVCEAPPAVLLERARERALRDSVSDAGPNIVAQELAVHRGRVMPPGTPLARLDTTQSIPEVMADLARTLDAQLSAGLGP